MREESNETTSSRFALVLDVDGILTTDKMYVSKDGTSLAKTYTTEDFQLLYRMAKLGVNIIFLTHERPQITRMRLEALDIFDRHMYYINSDNKKNEVVKLFNKGYKRIHYIGDSIFTDLPIALFPGVRFYTPFNSPIAKLLQSDKELFRNYNVTELESGGGTGVLIDWFITAFRYEKEGKEIWKKLMSHLVSN